MELLVEGEVAGELVAPVRYLYDRFGLGLELLGVYLDHPDLVRSLVGQLPDGRVLREETVPVGPPVASPHRTEDGRDGGRGEYGVGGDPVSPAIEGPELAGEHVHGPDEQDGVGVLRLYLYLSEIHPPLEHPLELLNRRYGEIVVVGAYRRHRDVVLQVARPQDPRVDDLLVGCGGGVVPPEGVQRLRGPCPAAPEQFVPREQGADRPAGGAAQANHLVPFQLLRPKKPLEHPGRESRVAAAALARYGHTSGLAPTVQYPPPSAPPSPNPVIVPAKPARDGSFVRFLIALLGMLASGSFCAWPGKRDSRGRLTI